MANTTEQIIKRQSLAEADSPPGVSQSTPMSVDSRIKPEEISRMRPLDELLANAYHP